MKKTKTKCYLYTRVSTSMQVDGYSLDAQRDKLRKYAEYEDMVVAGEYSDEGFSGKNIRIFYRKSPFICIFMQCFHVKYSQMEGFNKKFS